MRTDSLGAEISEVNMTPFVDIVLVLLVIFMATTTLIAENKLNIEVPKASASTDKPEEKRDWNRFYNKRREDLHTRQRGFGGTNRERDKSRRIQGCNHKK